MADQTAPAGPVDPAAAAMARNQGGMFSKTPDVTPRTPSAEEMRQAGQTAGERGQTIAEKSAEYMRQYDRPNDAKPAELPIGNDAQKQTSAGAEQPVDREALERDVSAFRKWQADNRVRAELLPSPEAYKVVLPEGFKTPAGIEFKFKDGDPMLEQARSWAHKRGLDQEAFSEALGLYAGEQVRQAEQFKAARDAEVAKLGSTAPARVDSILNFLASHLGRDGANTVATMLVTAAQVEQFERLIGKFVNGGVISGPGGGAREPVGRSPTDEQWRGMGFGEKLSYARSASAPVKQGRR